MSSKKKESLVIALLLLVFSVILFFSATRIPVSGALGAGADFPGIFPAGADFFSALAGSDLASAGAGFWSCIAK